MADSRKFGQILRDAREASGEDLVTVARRIRIRPDILERIEYSDLDGMPPRGYSRNMINAYARYLGLNPTEIVKMYLEAQQNHQLDVARHNLRPTGFNMDTGRTMRDRRELADVVGVGAPTRSTRRNEAFDELFPSYDARSGSYYAGASTGAGAYSSSRTNVGSARDALRDESVSRGIGSVHVGSYNGYGEGMARRKANSDRRDAGATRALEPVRESRASRRARQTASSDRGYQNIYAGNSMGRGGGIMDAWRDRIPFIFAALLILVLVVVIAVVVNSMKAPAQEESQTTMNISGMPETAATTTDDGTGEATGDGESADATQVGTNETAPTSTLIEFSVDDGQTAYVEVYDGTYENGGTVLLADTLSGPYSERYEVSGTLQFTTTNPDAIVLKQDGEIVEFTENSSGVYTEIFRFEDVLDKWNKDHGVAASDDSESGEGDEGSSEESSESGDEGSSEESSEEEYSEDESEDYSEDYSEDEEA